MSKSNTANNVTYSSHISSNLYAPNSTTTQQSTIIINKSTMQNSNTTNANGGVNLQAKNSFTNTVSNQSSPSFTATTTGSLPSTSRNINNNNNKFDSINSNVEFQSYLNSSGVSSGLGTNKSDSMLRQQQLQQLEQQLQNEKDKKKIGHREIKDGVVHYKKVPTDELKKSIQFGIVHFLNEQIRTNIDRDLLMQDFQVVENIEFRRAGSATTPPHNFSDFKLKVYAPYGFKYIRKKFNVNEVDFMVSQNLKKNQIIKNRLRPKQNNTNKAHCAITRISTCGTWVNYVSFNFVNGVKNLLNQKFDHQVMRKMFFKRYLGVLELNFQGSKILFKFQIY
jgi:hypothetical protein